MKSEIDGRYRTMIETRIECALGSLKPAVDSCIHENVLPNVRAKLSAAHKLLTEAYYEIDVEGVV